MKDFVKRNLVSVFWGVGVGERDSFGKAGAGAEVGPPPRTSSENDPELNDDEAAAAAGAGAGLAVFDDSEGTGDSEEREDECLLTVPNTARWTRGEPEPVFTFMFGMERCDWTTGVRPVITS